MGGASTRYGWRRLAALLAVLAGLMLAGVPVAEAKLGPRVTVGVYGDSVVEAYTIPRYLRDGLVPQLRSELARAGGFELGATGFIPLTPFRWHFNSYTVAKLDAPRPNAWVLSGFASYGSDGPSGYSGLALSPLSTATTPIDGPFVALLFTKFAGGGVFTVTAGSQTFTINAGSTGPPTPTEQFITVPAGARTITVHGPSSGTLVFDGAIVRGPVTPGRIGVEVENLGHMGQTLSEDSGPRILDSLLQQRFDISVFISAYLWELRAAAGSSKRWEAAYADELRTRVGVVRRSGGLCLIADPSPLPFSPSLMARFATISRTVAREQGCAYTGALAHLWNAATAIQTGMTLVDQIHPRARGYHLMAQALTPQLVRLVRQRVRTRGF